MSTQYEGFMTAKRTASQRGKMSRNKGKNLERFVATSFKSRGFEARRAVQYDGAFSHDVKIDIPFNLECKAVENLNIQQAFQQAYTDSQRAKTIPVVVHKKNNQRILTTMEFTDFIDLVQWALGYVDELNSMDLKEFRDKFMEKKRIEILGEELL